MSRTYDEYWNDDKNWRLGVYSCREDPRVIVPKRPKWAGMTLNFAHRKAAWTLLAATLLIALLPTIIAFSVYGQRAPERFGFWAGQLVSIAVILVMYYCFEFEVKSER